MRFMIAITFLQVSMVQATLLPVCENPKPQELNPGAVSYIDGQAQSSSDSLKEIVNKALTSSEQSYFSQATNIRYNWFCERVTTCTLYLESSFNRLQNGIADTAQDVYYRTRKYFDEPMENGSRSIQEILVTQRSINRDAVFLINGEPMKEENMAIIDSYIDAVEKKKIPKIDLGKETRSLVLINPESTFTTVENSRDIILSSPNKKPMILGDIPFNSNGPILGHGHTFIVIKDSDQVMIVSLGRVRKTIPMSEFTTERWESEIREMDGTTKMTILGNHISVMSITPS